MRLSGQGNHIPWHQHRHVCRWRRSWSSLSTVAEAVQAAVELRRDDPHNYPPAPHSLYTLEGEDILNAPLLCAVCSEGLEDGEPKVELQTPCCSCFQQRGVPCAM